MQQNFKQHQTFKQQLNLNQKLLQSIDFLSLDSISIQEKIHEALESNPFLESHSLTYDENYTHLSSQSSLYDDLNRQLMLFPKPFQKNIIDYLILSLNHHGFLSYSDQTYIQDLHISSETFQYHLDILQSLEPIGIGARDAIESICIQLKHKGYTKALHFMQEYRHLILSMNYKNIKQTLHLSQNEIDEIYQHIRSCNPFPYTAEQQDKIIIPEISIKVEDQEIQIVPLSSFQLSLNTDLFEKVKDDKHLKSYFDEAHFLIEDLNKRTQTILMITNELVNIQKNYFLFHDELYPCSLSDLAQRTHFHISTISRALNNKYFLFHGEVYPLKSLMTTQTKNGDSCDAIKKAIVSVISQEDKTRPLSDEQIVKKLQDIDLICSRRTIAKYREQLHIPSSSKRRKKL